MTESPRHASSASDFRGMPLAAFLILLGAYHLTFGRFFPTASGIVGNLPIKDLHPGPVRDLTDGHYNIKNPACYVYPKENGCLPGDHFRADQTFAMESFVSYRPFEFKVSLVQRVADLVTLIALGVCGIVLVTVLGLSIRAALRGRSGAMVG